MLAGKRDECGVTEVFPNKLIIKGFTHNLVVNFQVSDNVGDKYRILHEKCGRTVFTHELLTYQKSNE